MLREHMSRGSEEPGCYDVAFRAAYPLDEPAEVALEDYARALTRGRAAEAVRATDDPAMVQGVHVCGLAVALTGVVATDIEDFARSAATGPAGSGLGWS